MCYITFMGQGVTSCSVDKQKLSLLKPLWQQRPMTTARAQFFSGMYRRQNIFNGLSFWVSPLCHRWAVGGVILGFTMRAGTNRLPSVCLCCYKIHDTTTAQPLYNQGRSQPRDPTHAHTRFNRDVFG